jgi:hypothetical protein
MTDELAPPTQREYPCLLTAGSDVRFWLRMILASQLLAAGACLVLLRVRVPSGILVVFVLLGWLSQQRLTVTAEDIQVRWLFFRKVVPKGSILDTEYSAQSGVLKSQTLQVWLKAGSKLEIRASARVLRSLGEDLWRFHGNGPKGTIIERANFIAPWRFLFLQTLFVVAGIGLGLLFFGSLRALVW